MKVRFRKFMRWHADCIIIYNLIIISYSITVKKITTMATTCLLTTHMWQTQVENEHYSTLSGLVRLVISLDCFMEITPDFLCPFMND